MSGERPPVPERDHEPFTEADQRQRARYFRYLAETVLKVHGMLTHYDSEDSAQELEWTNPKTRTKVHLSADMSGYYAFPDAASFTLALDKLMDHSGVPLQVVYYLDADSSKTSAFVVEPEDLDAVADARTHTAFHELPPMEGGRSLVAQLDHMIDIVKEGIDIINDPYRPK